MGRYFLPQRDALEKSEVPTPEMIENLNSLAGRADIKLYTEFGIDVLNPDAHTDEPGKTPRAFVLKDGKVSTLTESNIKPGSREFWETAMKGQLFGYRLGAKDPVQIQAWMGTTGLDYSFSDPLEPGKEAPFPEEPEKPKGARKLEKPVKPQPVEEPAPVAEPGKEPPRYNFWTKVGAFFGRKASKDKIAAHDAWSERRTAYQTYQTKLEEYQDYQEALESHESGL